VFASQWSIADEATREWMVALYAARARGTTSGSEALRAASRSMLEARRRHGRSTHPFYWAAFSATGR
jgi:CHAT domain-containing protein